MIKRPKPLLFLFLLVSITMEAQQITLKGKITDSLSIPLAYANVIAKPFDLQKTIKFSITDDEGFYRLELERDNSYTILISFMGFSTEEFEFDGKENSIKNVVLNEKANRLEEVLIELPVIVKQDTVIYKTDHFVSGEERKLKNVLKKLPGVEVKKNGDVLVQGRKITKMLVEGKKFFGGGSKLAVENIPANAVDKVQVIDNYNEVEFLKGLSDTEELAMNIQLKEDKKKFIFGDIEAGKGNQDFYRTHGNLFYYSPKYNINFIGNLSNTGEKTFTFKDYMNFQGGISAALKDGSSFFNVAGSDFSQFMETQDLVTATNQFAAFNLTKTVSKKLDIGGYLIFSNSKNTTLNKSLNQYTFFNEEKERNSAVDNLLGIGKLNIEYAPSTKEQWYFRTQLKKSTRNLFSNITSITNESNTELLTDHKAEVYVINQNMEWHINRSKKHTFSLALDFSLNQNDPSTIWNTNQPLFTNLLPLVHEDTISIQQKKEARFQKLNAILKHYWVLNGNNHIYTTIGTNLIKEQFFTADGQLLGNGQLNYFDVAGFGNDLDFQLEDLFVGIHYKFRAGIGTFKQGVIFRNYHWTITQGSSLEKKKFLIQPDFLADFEFSKSKKLKLKYQLKSNMSNGGLLAKNYYLRSYNSIFRGNEQLENELYHNATAYFSRFSMYRGIMFNSYLGFLKKEKGIRNTVQFDQTDQYLQPVILENPEERWFLNTNLRKKIKNINYQLGLDFSTANYVQPVDQENSKNENTRLGYELSAKTLFDNFPVIELGVKQTFGNFTSGTTKSKFIITEPFLNIDYDFLNHYDFSFDYTNYNYENKNSGLKERYQLANFSISYKNENRPWSFKLDVKNIFDMKFKKRHSFSSYIISETSVYVLPRMILFSVAYQL